MKWTLEFEDLDKACIAEAGMKCANLGELAKIGVPVPPGFVVSAAALDLFLKKTGAGEKINEKLRGFIKGPKEIGEYEELSRTLTQIIVSGEIPAEIQESILLAYKRLCSKCNRSNLPVAVRSSGCSEDLPTAAFAGQYESYLNVRGETELSDRVRDCWASLFTARVISYRLKNDMPIIDQLMGVIVQRLVDARSAGVAFTALPSTGDLAWIMLEGNWGMAESVVQGIVSPDKYYVNKKTLSIEEKSISQKLRQYLLSEKGTKEEEITADMQAIPCFSDEEAIKIAEIAKIIESHYDAPQDIEWAIERDLPFPENIFFVQTRPITTLKKKSGTDQIIDFMLSKFIHK
ncbi:PEP/pyruvate-binding domain-containing protein [Thermodesulfobacteriota bacterium]